MTLTPAVFLALKRGDHGAFHEVYAQYRSLLFVVILSVVRHEPTAEDLLQDTFLKIYQKAHTVRSLTQFKAWAVMVAKRTALNYLKKRGEDEWQDHYDQTVAGGEEKHLFQTWHANLSDEENLIIAYKIVYDLGFADIAKIMDVSMTAVYKRYQEALRKLKAVYQTK
jgi:RNA polymerase sigma-70 factor, ECF subfamily